MNYIKEYESYQKNILNKSDDTLKNYKSDINAFMTYTKKDLKDIDVTDIENYLSKLALDGLAPSSRARKLSSLKSYFKYLYKNKIVSENVAINIKSPKIPKRIPQYLNIKESKRLLSKIEGNSKNDIRDYAIITLFLNCGLRLSELKNIKLSDINEDELRIIGKGNKERITYLNDNCIKAVKDYLAIRENVNNSFLFLSNRKTIISNRTIQYIIKNRLKNAKLDTTKYSTHKLRHTAATLMYQNGTDIRTIQVLLGHEKLSTTEIYTQVNVEQMKKAVKNNPLSNINIA